MSVRRTPSLGFDTLRLEGALLNLIAGIDKPTHGTIEIAGVDIATLGEGVLADEPAAPQDHL